MIEPTDKKDIDMAINDNNNSYINIENLKKPKELKKIIFEMMAIKKRLTKIKKEIEHEKNPEKLNDFKEILKLIKKRKYSEIDESVRNFLKKYPDVGEKYDNLCR